MFLLFLGVIAAIVGVIVFLTVRTKKKQAAFGGLIVGVLLAVLLIASSCISSVPTGHTGVVTTFGRVENYTLDSGLHFVLPWQSVVKMDNRVQKETVELSCFSSDIQEVSMVYTVNFQIKKSDAMTIYSTIGTDYYNTVIAPAIAESVKIVTARYNAEEIIGRRSELAQAIEEDIATKLIYYNIELVSTSIEDMDFTDAFTNAVEEKQVAEQNKLRAETEAEQKVIEAEAEAEIRKTEADAAAYEIITRAEAEAEANELISNSLTQELIDYTYAEKWDGKLPTFVAGENGMTPVFDFGSSGVTQAEN
ncbi:MAG: prohibitin family protein [Oscillospiraceae bacterium]|nr:prohibitin family protein [Oscillospiraceae bacterium]